nr:putative integron gene cassette protein [uncultured bacterium]
MTSGVRHRKNSQFLLVAMLRSALRSLSARLSHLRQLILHVGCACISSLSLQRALHSGQIAHAWLRHGRNVRGLRTQCCKTSSSPTPRDRSAGCAQPARLRFRKRLLELQVRRHPGGV